MTGTEWPFGPFLADAIEASGLKKRAVARAAGISEGRLRQLEDGFQKSHGAQIPIRTTRSTVTQLSRVLGFPLQRGLELAGLAEAGDSSSTGPSGTGATITLKAWSVEELLYEVRARFGEVSGESPSSAPHLAAVDEGDALPLTTAQITARSGTIVALQELADERRASGDEHGAQEVVSLAFDLSRQLDAISEAEDISVEQANDSPVGRRHH
ncbi:MAG: helix-turn-helix transcriptional regulator [Jatrophihabitantaceae bacterium]